MAKEFFVISGDFEIVHCSNDKDYKELVTECISRKIEFGGFDGLELKQKVACIYGERVKFEAKDVSIMFWPDV